MHSLSWTTGQPRNWPQWLPLRGRLTVFNSLPSSYLFYYALCVLPIFQNEVSVKIEILLKGGNVRHRQSLCVKWWPWWDEQVPQRTDLVWGSPWSTLRRLAASKVRLPASPPREGHLTWMEAFEGCWLGSVWAVSEPASSKAVLIPIVSCGGLRRSLWQQWDKGWGWEITKGDKT